MDEAEAQFPTPMLVRLPMLFDQESGIIEPVFWMKPLIPEVMPSRGEAAAAELRFSVAPYVPALAPRVFTNMSCMACASALTCW
ncbi:pE family protein [Mycobacterium ulcerans str. Harvey]|uniref:PE family protein n=1 Tax=Mycobacterium ulcerans str. Harvey TaxID=1299332 RepID=A0ABN0QMW6_MYCUL|nr:pE family protein [Mycobacterium ulcerans str. Harvey]